MEIASARVLHQSRIVRTFAQVKQKHMIIGVNMRLFNAIIPSMAVLERKSSPI